MKVVYVVDSITKLTDKINLLSLRFGNNILFVVRADLVELFKTYGYQPNAIYYNNLTRVIQSLLLRGSLEDVVICYASLKFDNNLLNKFISGIGDRKKIVNLMPIYNTFEQMCNSTYNLYVRSLFKVKDSLISTKLQFIPQDIMIELLATHLGNRLFELNPELTKNISIEDNEINKSMKTKSHSVKYNIISIIIALCVTIGLLASIAYYKPSFIIIFFSSLLYLLDIALTIIFHCKSRFDNRFLK